MFLTLDKGDPREQIGLQAVDDILQHLEEKKFRHTFHSRNMLTGGDRADHIYVECKKATAVSK